MPQNKSCEDEEFLALIAQYGVAGTARHLGVDLRNTRRRLRKLENGTGFAYVRSRAGAYEQRLPLNIQDGIILIGSDAHFWPDERPTAFRGMCKFAIEMKDELRAVVLNGDVFDGPSISRHPPIGWENPPSVAQELVGVEACLDELQDSSPNAIHLWTIGNHDSRFENRLAKDAPQFNGVKGFRLADHFPDWKICWSIWVNDDLVIKHRFKGGIHATHNNTLWSGKSMATGHLHSLKVTPFSDYNGIRFAVDTGTLNNPYGPHTAYTEENPLNHRSGFAVITFHKGVLLWPELAYVIDEKHIGFRGKVIAV